MDIWPQLLQGFQVALTVQNLMFCLHRAASSAPRSACCRAWVPR